MRLEHQVFFFNNAAVFDVLLDKVELPWKVTMLYAK